jgi:hypothetical protein
VSIVGKDLGYFQSSHKSEREMVHNACAISLPAFAGQPRGLPIFDGWGNETLPRLHLIAQSANSGSVRPAGDGIAALQQYKAACDQISPASQQFRETGLGRMMPLVAFIPNGQ